MCGVTLCFYQQYMTVFASIASSTLQSISKFSLNRFDIFLVEFTSRHFVSCVAVVNAMFSYVISSNKLCLYIKAAVSKFYVLLSSRIFFLLVVI